MNNVVVKIEKSGNRFNAWDADGVKYTSHIGTSTRKKAYNAGMALERRTGKNGRIYWWKVPMSEFESTTAPVIDVSSVDVPTDHAEVLNFIHSSYNLKPAGLVMKELVTLLEIVGIEIELIQLSQKCMELMLSLLM